MCVCVCVFINSSHLHRHDFKGNVTILLTTVEEEKTRLFLIVEVGSRRKWM